MGTSSLLVVFEGDYQDAAISLLGFDKVLYRLSDYDKWDELPLSEVIVFNSMLYTSVTVVLPPDGSITELLDCLETSYNALSERMTEEVGTITVTEWGEEDTWILVDGQMIVQVEHSDPIIEDEDGLEKEGEEEEDWE